MKTMMINDSNHKTKLLRKARTRTLIQVGGLLKLSGLLDFFEIVEGEDLQLNIQGQEKAATLIGFLNSLEKKTSTEVFQKETWKKEGFLKLKESKKLKNL